MPKVPRSLFIAILVASPACRAGKGGDAPPPAAPPMQARSAASAPPAAPSEPENPPASGAMLRGLSVVKEASLGAPLEERRLTGVVALLRGDAESVSCNDVERCMTEYTPASTFKIPNSIIGLETGVIRDAEFVIPWDGKQYTFPQWNRDHTLRTAIRDSAVPYYMELARRVGPARMQGWLDRLEYGNCKMGDPVDAFWLEEGPLRIAPVEQVEFLRRLETGKLPIAARTRDIVRDISVRARRGARTFRGKTGLASPGTAEEIGWFVGWVESELEGATYVALAVLDPPEGVDVLPLRQAMAEEVLARARVWELETPGATRPR